GGQPEVSGRLWPEQPGARGQRTGRRPLSHVHQTASTTRPASCGPCCFGQCLTAAASGRLDRVSLQAFLSLDDGEGNLLAFLQALEALNLDGAEVHEHILAVFTADEAKTLGIIEPLHRPRLTI